MYTQQELLKMQKIINGHTYKYNTASDEAMYEEYNKQYDIFVQSINNSGKNNPVVLYTATEIKELNQEIFTQWIETILFKVDNHEIIDSNDNWLDECICPNTFAHARFIKDNLRKVYEEQILSSIDNQNSSNKNSEINLLSIGSGGLLQDLIILLKLYKSGYTNIVLDCIDTDFQLSENTIISSKDQLVKQTNDTRINILSAIVNKLNTEQNCNFTVNYSKQLNVTEQKKYDAVYAIDFDDEKGQTKDFSQRQLEKRSASLKSEDFARLSLLINGYSHLKNDPNALFLLSYGNNLITNQVIKMDEITGFNELLSKDNDYECFYVRSNLFSILQNLPLIKKFGQLIVINKEIMDETTRKYMEALLRSQNIQYEIVDHKAVASHIKNYPDAKMLIIDDTVCDFKKHESPIEPELFGVNVKFTRIANENHENDNEQSKCAIQIYPAKDYKECVIDGIKKYIKWSEQNTQGIRGISRFSHWHHGASGLSRAKKLLVDLNQKNNHEAKNLVETILKKSSITRHSLSRFIYKELTSSVHTHKMLDKNYKIIKNKFNL